MDKRGKAVGSPESFGWLMTGDKDHEGFDIWERPDGTPMRVPPGPDTYIVRMEDGTYEWTYADDLFEKPRPRPLRRKADKSGKILLNLINLGLEVMRQQRKELDAKRKPKGGK